MRLFACGIVGFLACLSMAAGVAIAGERPDVAGLYAMASDRQASIRSVSVEFHGESVRLKDAPSVLSTLQGSFHLEFKTDGTRIFSRVIRAAGTGNSGGLTTAAFDGKNCVELKGRMAKLTRTPLPSLGSYEGYCSGALQIPYNDYDKANFDKMWFYPHVLRKVPNVDRLYRLLDSPEDVDGASCLVVEYPGHDKLWIDVALHGALRRRQRSEPGPNGTSWIMSDHRFKDFIEAAPGVFVPMHCDYTGYAVPADPPEWKDTPVFRTHIDVDRISLNDVSDADFAIRLPPGTFVGSDDGRSYVVPGDRPVEGIDQLVKQLPPLREKSAPGLWLLLAAALGLVAVVVWHQRRYRSTR